MKGVFICIEGLDGSGKTTQAKLLTKKLCKAGYNAIYTAEPSQGKIGKFIRKCLYDQKRMSTITEALLFAADRIEHIQNTISPALKEGKIVIVDRYIYSSLAYQGSTSMNIHWIETINTNAQKPDLSLFIDVAPEVVLDRLNRKKSVMENLQTQQCVRQIYQKYVATDELKRIDGNENKNKVSDKLYAEVMYFLKNTIHP
ncbi:MAG: dTMP kinase [Nitrososphaerota archaeon]|jgi:dTMP kinase|nr:dTMP kinase [Nitrososphaerota archaeon]